MSSNNVGQAGLDVGPSRLLGKVLHEKLLPHVHRLQNCQLNSEDKTACSLKTTALLALHGTYSLGLRPSNLTETSLETLLQSQLLEMINKPYGIHDNSTGAAVESPDSPLWGLHNLSLKLTRLFVDNGHLSAGTNKTIEDHFTKLLETIQECQLKGQACPRTSKNIAIIAHCLCKIFKTNKPTGSAQRRLLSPSFICDNLFPLACEFTAKEYPASVLDPISYYEMFESSGKLVEPDEALIEWNRRNEERGASGDLGNSSKRIRLEEKGSDVNEDDVYPLPPAHVCLEHLIFKLTVSNNQANQDIIIEFLQRKVLKLRDKQDRRNLSSFPMLEPHDDVSEFGLMNKIVALHVLGRLKLHPILREEISFLKMFVLPNKKFTSYKLKHDSLLLKICNFQIVRFLRTDDIEQRIRLAKAFLDEFIKVMQIEDYQDPRNKMFVIFASVASECLHKLRGSERLKSLFDNYSTPLDGESKLILVRKITDLYLDYKIVAPLALVDIIYEKDQNGGITGNIERLMTKVIDSIATELLVISPASDRAQNLSRHLYTATYRRDLLLPAATVDRLVRLAKISTNDEDYHPSSFLQCALSHPLEERTKFLAIELLDRFLKDLSKDDLQTLNHVTTILGNLCYHQVTSSTLAPISNNSATSSEDLHEEYRSRNPLFESHERMRDILASCDRIKGCWANSWVMHILMSWPSPREASVIEPPNEVSSFNSTWYCFVDFAIRETYKLDPRNIVIPTSRRIKKNRSVRNFEIDNDLLFAFMAAINYDPKRLEDYLNHIIGPIGRGQSHISNYVRLWLDSVIENDDCCELPDREDVGFEDRSHVVISHQALINIHQAQTAGKLGFSIKRLARKLNSARQNVLKWLANRRQQAIETDSPLEKFYVNSIRQLEKIGSFK